MEHSYSEFSFRVKRDKLNHMNYYSILNLQKDVGASYAPRLLLGLERDYDCLNDALQEYPHFAVKIPTPHLIEW